jgi:hypothetical protein
MHQVVNHLDTVTAGEQTASASTTVPSPEWDVLCVVTPAMSCWPHPVIVLIVNNRHKQIMPVKTSTFNSSNATYPEVNINFTVVTDFLATIVVTPTQCMYRVSAGQTVVIAK